MGVWFRVWQWRDAKLNTLVFFSNGGVIESWGQTGLSKRHSSRNLSGRIRRCILGRKKNKQFHHKVDEHHAALPEEMFYFSFFTSQHVQPEVNKSWIKLRIRSCDLAVDDTLNS